MRTIKVYAGLMFVLACGPLAMASANAAIVYKFTGVCQHRQTIGPWGLEFDGPCANPSFSGTLTMPDSYVPGAAFSAFNISGVGSPLISIMADEPFMTTSSSTWGNIALQLPVTSGPATFVGSTLSGSYLLSMGGGSFSFFRESPFPGGTRITGSVSDFSLVPTPPTAALVLMALALAAALGRSKGYTRTLKPA